MYSSLLNIEYTCFYRHFKASSIWLNGIITVAGILIYPTILLDALDTAGVRTIPYKKWIDVLSPFCMVYSTIEIFLFSIFLHVV